MEILEGQLPEKSREWLVLFARTPRAPLANTWDLAVLLAQAGEGGIILVVVIEEDSEAQRAAAREAIDKAQEDCEKYAPLYGVITTHESYNQGTKRLVHDYNVDILVDDISDPVYNDLDSASCAVVGVRGDKAGFIDGEEGITRILVPTSGGPNSVYALSVLLPLTPDVEVTALYVAPDYLGPNELALGRVRLKETIKFVDGEDRIQTKLIAAPTVSQGIREEAKEHDLVLIGASAES